MNEPTTPTTPYTAYVAWARENKKRADRLLAAAKAVNVSGIWEWLPEHSAAYEAVSELLNAATDYEDKRG